jgi:cell division protein FtsB
LEQTNKQARWEGEFHMADDELSGKLAGLLTEIKEVMESRKERIEELRNEIADIEAQNIELEKTISDLLSGFD